MRNILEAAVQPQILNGWKDIANYLGKGVRTVQRYERELGLPVRRPAGKSIGSVIATKAELDGWIMASPIREGFRLPHSAADNATLLKEFRQHIKQLHQLRGANELLRKELHASVELLHTNLRLTLPQQDQSTERSLVSRALADVLPFNPVKKKTN